MKKKEKQVTQGTKRTNNSKQNKNIEKTSSIATKKNTFIQCL